MAPIDVLAAAILVLALVRGLFLGLVREALSLGAIAGAALAVRGYASPFGEWLAHASDGAIAHAVAPWIAGTVLVVSVFTAVALVGRLLRRGVKAAGLGWADRAGGAALGAAEGAVVVAIVLFVCTTALGREHSTLRGSLSLRALERFEVFAQDGDWPQIDVAAPPRFSRD